MCQLHEKTKLGKMDLGWALRPTKTELHIWYRRANRDLVAGMFGIRQGSGRPRFLLCWCEVIPEQSRLDCKRSKQSRKNSRGSYSFHSSRFCLTPGFFRRSPLLQSTLIHGWRSGEVLIFSVICKVSSSTFQVSLPGSLFVAITFFLLRSPGLMVLFYGSLSMSVAIVGLQFRDFC